MRFLLRARVAPWLIWSAVVAVLASPLAGAAEHCAHSGVSEGSTVLGHDHDSGHRGHRSEPEDSSDPTECPHCPPAQCGTQISCSAAGAELISTTSPASTSVLAAQVPAAPARQPVSTPSAPPTPPPQHRA